MKLTNKCCGCGACSIICPVGAVKIELSKEGFYESKINKNKCIKCGLCKKVCNGVTQEKTSKLNVNENYIAAVKDLNILEKSSSGGIAYIIAKTYLKLGYPVCGVEWNNKKQIAQHIIVTDEADLSKIQGSKYVQSYTEKAFKKIISQERAVIFGTPCQIAALDKILKLKKKRHNFILIDIFCHGVPSLLSLKNHINWLKKSKKIKCADKIDVSFREKKKYIMKVNEYRKSCQYDAFYYMFLGGLVFCEQCYDCLYRRNSFSDIRLGDFTSNNYSKLTYSPSNIIINSKKGKEVIKNINDYINIYKINFENVDNVQVKGMIKIPAKRKKILEELQKGKFPTVILKKEMIEKYIKGNIKFILNLISRKDKNLTNDINLIEKR